VELYNCIPIPTIATHFSVVWSVCLSFVCLSHTLCFACVLPLLKAFNGCICHLAGTLVVSNDTLC